MKTQICLWATPEEVQRIEAIKSYHHRTSSSDVMRFLVIQEYEKIFVKNISNEIIPTTDNTIPPPRHDNDRGAGTRPGYLRREKMKNKNLDTQLVVYSKASLRIVGLTKPAVELPDQYALGLVELKEDGKVVSDPPGLWVDNALSATITDLTRNLLRKPEKTNA